jgi:hypothetical protein
VPEASLVYGLRSALAAFCGFHRLYDASLHGYCLLVLVATNGHNAGNLWRLTGTSCTRGKATGPVRTGWHGCGSRRNQSCSATVSEAWPRSRVSTDGVWKQRTWGMWSRQRPTSARKNGAGFPSARFRSDAKGAMSGLRREPPGARSAPARLLSSDEVRRPVDGAAGYRPARDG